MANKDHVILLKQGRQVWNEWRQHRSGVSPELSAADLHGMNLFGADLSDADLSDANLSGADLSDASLAGANLSKARLSGANMPEANLAAANLSKANLSRADLPDAYLSGANLSGANLSGANLWKANLSRADLLEADLSGADLSDANLSGANLSRAILFRALLTGTDFSGAKLDGAYIYGVSVWDVALDGAQQSGLVITQEGEPCVVVDNLEVAQFIYLILHNKSIRSLIDIITSKVVLILGRFTAARKPILDSLRTALRARGYSPVLFDFEKPASRDLTETISILAGMARFVIADITDAKSIPHELMMIVPTYPSVPVQPLLQSSQNEYGMFEHLRRYPWVLPVVLYDTQEHLLDTLEAQVIGPVETRLWRNERRIGRADDDLSSPIFRQARII
jgi:uncharacterized protein YjbI with pentapeptide repeats